MSEAIKTIAIKTIRASHIAPITKIIRQIGVKEVSACFQQPEFQGESEESVKKLGIAIAVDIVAIIMENYETCQDDIFRLVAELTDKTAEEVGELPLDEFTEIMVAIITSPNFSQAFTVASKLLK